MNQSQVIRILVSSSLVGVAIAATVLCASGRWSPWVLVGSLLVATVTFFVLEPWKRAP